MSETELWKYFLDSKVSLSRPFDRNLIWITKEDFEPVKKYFVKEFNIFHRGKSFRSQNYFSHIHVIEQGEYVLVHHDMGNVAKFLPLGIIHLFVDVLPYVVLARVKGVPFLSIFSRPK